MQLYFDGQMIEINPMEDAARRLMEHGIPRDTVSPDMLTAVMGVTALMNTRMLAAELSEDDYPTVAVEDFLKRVRRAATSPDEMHPDTVIFMVEELLKQIEGAKRSFDDEEWTADRDGRRVVNDNGEVICETNSEVDAVIIATLHRLSTPIVEVLRRVLAVLDKQGAPPIRIPVVQKPDNAEGDSL